ncbi:hypothetical protein TNCV_3795721 [Trichonephila clavipes]|nr:hypothetical protein TNCV_3795721 [Trichonephila clavipes]
MGNALEIFCDVSREKVRPYVSEELHFEVFRSLHNLSHPGIRATKRLIQDRFVWPVEGLKPSFTAPYQGPFEVLSRTDKHFTIKINDRTSTISIDRLKPQTQQKSPSQRRNIAIRLYFLLDDQSVPIPATTRSGRRSFTKRNFMDLFLTPFTGGNRSNNMIEHASPHHMVTAIEPMTRQKPQVCGHDHLATKVLRRDDEAHFWLNGYVNKQNCRIWSQANPQVYVETPLNPEN